MVIYMSFSCRILGQDLVDLVRRYGGPEGQRLMFVKGGLPIKKASMQLEDYEAIKVDKDVYDVLNHLNILEM